MESKILFRIENYDILWNGMYTVLTGSVDFVQCPSSFSGYNFGGSPAVIFLCHLSANRFFLCASGVCPWNT